MKSLLNFVLVAFIAGIVLLKAAQTMNHATAVHETALYRMNYISGLELIKRPGESLRWQARDTSGVVLPEIKIEPVEF